MNIRARFCFFLITLCGLLQSHAAIEITISGGRGSPLEVEVITGGDFISNVNASSINGDPFYLWIFFEDIWNNTLESNTTGAAVSTAALNGSSESDFTGTYAFVSDGLFLGFSSVATTLTLGELVPLTTGTRITDVDLNLDYTTVGSISGNAYLFRGVNFLSEPLSYNATFIPEARAYAHLALFSMVTVVLIWKRRRLA
ncbi:hypothetical protein [Rubellicoccus peritrichatus]|uniref:Uncharacterized protein n=1 Tax=Rubellicoccus peritrichatus TaxID=3080537 RepID=A0AAQ3LC02_9BACT|nr:hypothetical protein [Puniceicoccus sp. CR14]WOO40693.1 hypothetical protein RZN69_18890 [Puniceicoccus sp. CR14]